MNLTEAQLLKADERLVTALQANDKESLCCIFTVRHAKTEFPRTERSLAIQHAEGVIQPTVDALKALELKVNSLPVLYMIIVEGSPSKIAEALNIPSVAYASLDREMHIID